MKISSKNRTYDLSLIIHRFLNRFHDFHSPPLDEADFDAKPMILLVGQYSTGKTTFIKYLLEQEFPGMRIGPEPTTDCFIIITKVQFKTSYQFVWEWIL